MLKAVFIGSKNSFDDILVHWLAQRVDLAGVVWTSSTAWQQSWQGRLSFARRRWKRYGLLKTIDETLFYLVYHTMLRERDSGELRRRVIEPYVAANAPVEWTGDSIFAANVNAPQVLDFIAQRQPDLAFAMCINNYFGKKLRAIPRQGVFLWHEGYTPSYKGLYSPFWAIHNLDFDRIGYSLLRMSDEIDAGEVFVQGSAKDVDPFRHHHVYAGHKAIWDSLPAVERFLRDLEAGQARPLDTKGQPDRAYTYPGLSDLLRQRMRLRRQTRNGSNVAERESAASS